MICLNMIVKNEAANIERCLRSVAPYIDCWVICDTGSTDGTQDFVRRYFADLGIPGAVVPAPFIDFAQARNAALDAASSITLPEWDYLLLCDADMELVADDPNWAKDLTAPAYLVNQRMGAMTYGNIRLVKHGAQARYTGVTHEVLNVESRAQLNGAWFIDHADGANRPGKYERDIRLLKAEVDANPSDARSWYYLAQSYRESGQAELGAAAYARRAALGGWDEEVFSARLNEARCLGALQPKDERGFVASALEAFASRPGRPEPLLELARHFREKGQNEATLLFAEAGLRVLA